MKITQASILAHNFQHIAPVPLLNTGHIVPHVDILNQQSPYIVPSSPARI